MKKMSLLILPFLLAACGPAPAPGASSADETAKPASPYAFDVNLTLTARAAERLKDTDERVIVSAMYYGLPTSDDAPGIDKEGMEVRLGASDIEVAPEVLINVYSARKTHENNLLNCGIYQGPVPMAQKKPVDVQCDLIEGLNEDGDVVVETGTPGQ